MDALISRRQATEIAVAVLVAASAASSVALVRQPALGAALVVGVSALGLAFAGYFFFAGVEVPVAPLAFGLVFVGLCGLGVLFWQDGVDVRDPLGVLLFFVALPVAVYVGFPNRRHSRRATRRALLAVLVLLAALSTWDLLAHGLAPGRRGFFGLNKNTVGLFFDLVYVYLLYSARSSRERFAVVAAGAVVLLGVFSKAAIAVCLLFTAGLYSRRLFWGTGVAIAAVAAVLVAGAVDVAMLQTAGYRLLLWTEAVEEILRSPAAFLLGSGPGTFEASISRYGLGGLSMHNYFLSILYGYGFVALAALLAFFAWIWQRCGLLEGGAAAAFWAFNLHGLIDVGWVLGPGFLASYMLGLALREGRGGPAPEYIRDGAGEKAS